MLLFNPFLDLFPVYLLEESAKPGLNAQGPQIHEGPHYPVYAFPNCTSSIPPGAFFGYEYWLVALTLRNTHSKTYNPTVPHLHSPFLLTVFLKLFLIYIYSHPQDSFFCVCAFSIFTYTCRFCVFDNLSWLTVCPSSMIWNMLRIFAYFNHKFPVDNQCVLASLFAG